LPSEQIFYKEFAYKVELSPKFKGLSTQRKVGCQIDIGIPEKGRAKLAEFNEKIEKLIQNVEFRHEMIAYVERLPNVKYKRRLGGENSLFYFADPQLVLLLCERYHAVINSVTGPINAEHEDVHAGSQNVITRKGLYYNKFRYCIRFNPTEEFSTKGIDRVEEVLTAIDANTWRTNSFDSVRRFWKRRSLRLTNFYTRPLSAAVYLTNPNDYVYLKLVAGEYVHENHEIVLFDELT
jgi:hypothetical protein